MRGFSSTSSNVRFIFPDIQYFTLYSSLRLLVQACTCANLAFCPPILSFVPPPNNLVHRARFSSCCQKEKRDWPPASYSLTSREIHSDDQQHINQLIVTRMLIKLQSEF